METRRVRMIRLDGLCRPRLHAENVTLLQQALPSLVTLKEGVVDGVFLVRIARNTVALVLAQPLSRTQVLFSLQRAASTAITRQRLSKSSENPVAVRGFLSIKDNDARQTEPSPADAIPNPGAASDPAHNLTGPSKQTGGRQSEPRVSLSGGAPRVNHLGG